MTNAVGEEKTAGKIYLLVSFVFSLGDGPICRIHADDDSIAFNMVKGVALCFQRCTREKPSSNFLTPVCRNVR